MSLTLKNDLSVTGGMQITAANEKIRALGQSLATGENASNDVVSTFLGSSLKSSAIVLGGVAESISYTSNLCSIAAEYVKNIITQLQSAIRIVSTAGSISGDSLVVQQKNIDDIRGQIENFAKTANFDKKNILSGDATNIKVQVGLNSTDTISVKIDNVSLGKLFKTTVAKGLNDLISTANGAATTYYNSANAATEINLDKLNNVNLAYAAITGTGGNGSGAKMTVAQLGTFLAALTPAQKADLDQMAPLGKALLTANAGTATTFSTASVAQLQAYTAAHLPTRATITTALTAMLGAVTYAGTTGGTATATAAVINAVVGLPQYAKDAATAAIAAGTTAATELNATGIVRKAAYDALITHGGLYEAYMRSFPVSTAANLESATTVAAALTTAGAQIATGTLYDVAIQASTTLPAGVKAASTLAIAQGAGAGAANVVVDFIVTQTAFQLSELGMIIQDNAATNISVAGNNENQAKYVNVLQNALNTMLALQANINSQKSNINAAADALKATANVTLQAADNYLAADLVVVAQEYAATIRGIIAAITALQAANKVPEAAQRLLEGLAR